jgi:hypothetical protein
MEIGTCPLADRQLAQGLPIKRVQNKHAAVKLFPLSVSIAVALSIFLAPVPRVFAAQECDMFGFHQLTQELSRLLRANEVLLRAQQG